jgi:hypothetical protein
LKGAAIRLATGRHAAVIAFWIVLGEAILNTPCHSEANWYFTVRLSGEARKQVGMEPENVRDSAAASDGLRKHCLRQHYPHVWEEFEHNTKLSLTHRAVVYLTVGERNG